MRSPFPHLLGLAHLPKSQEQPLRLSAPTPRHIPQLQQASWLRLPGPRNPFRTLMEMIKSSEWQCPLPTERRRPPATRYHVCAEPSILLNRIMISGRILPRLTLPRSLMELTPLQQFNRIHLKTTNQMVDSKTFPCRRSGASAFQMAPRRVPSTFRILR